MSKEVAFAIQDIPGKGKGVIATRDISGGELILAEAPLFTQNSTPTNATLLAALKGLTDTQQREFFSLANCHSNKHPPALGTWLTNALPCGQNDTVSGRTASKGGIFLQASRFNSSCLPNVNNRWVERDNKITIRAVRNIAKGEELCLCYIESWADRATRQRELREHFGFDCRCAVCSLTGNALRSSDRRRSSLPVLYQEIAACGSNPALGVRKIKLALKTLSEEGMLDTGASSFYDDAFQFCVFVADVKNAKAWAEKALESVTRLRGSDSEDAQQIEKHLRDPRTHMFFGVMGRKTLSGPE
ncbi:hypothetical protein WOLCODRAFT_155770 [Wolfiporia cocos MD-104 SS10]|uniref:SET domain-containing protein n=1 Tax=Wolfiporia cocos (strain MD-104) TaxID=742152 RepID=A0A2H3JBQ3_WOLCO|nr:hypothetical protein WOLCODRAFT_155770 [Wolfiporia cocos MD-104 SS10]